MENIIKEANSNISYLIRRLANEEFKDRGLCYPSIYEMKSQYSKYCKDGRCNECYYQFKDDYIKSMERKYLISK